ncbi:LCP family protein [Globicatella sulfidifaciens]|uniref:LCP family glycopolymer transferase n=1 Tax=Globicatella sulfidifaciens TaxID=136093 RepID=UPI00288CF4F5|nr:LCP family protein [Globicatella sulfidifaciens]MDT2767404.1 LCP family protein [Globicatella sulfidifaciens]
MNHETNKNKKKKRNWLKILIAIFVILLAVGLGLFIKVNLDINELKKSVVVEDISVNKLRDKEAEVDEGEPLNILLLGTDANNLERTEDQGFVSRSDTIMIVSLNPQTQTTKMLSIPRDTLSFIEGYDEPEKINHAYAYGGIETAIDTIQAFLNIPIDYYAVLDMSGLEELIDAIGGIEVTSPLTFTYRGTQFKKGETREVNGVKAMNFARMRYDDPEGEVGRQNRQKMVIKAIMDKLLSLNAVTYYPKILQVVAKNVKTNFDLTTILSVYPKYVSALNNISAIEFDEMQPLYLEDIFYFNIPVSARLKVSNELRAHTQLETILASSLADPMADNENEFIKSELIVMNQYPSGLTQEQIDVINQQQAELDRVRDLETSYNEGDIYQQPTQGYEAPSYQPSDTEAPYYPPQTEQPSVTEPPVHTESVTEPPIETAPSVTQPPTQSEPELTEPVVPQPPAE